VRGNLLLQQVRDQHRNDSSLLRKGKLVSPPLPGAGDGLPAVSGTQMVDAVLLSSVPINLNRRFEDGDQRR